jgi:hypothetical protein
MMNVDEDFTITWQRHLLAHPDNALHVPKAEIEQRLNARIKEAEDEVKRLKNLKEDALLRTVVD